MSDSFERHTDLISEYNVQLMPFSSACYSCLSHLSHKEIILTPMYTKPAKTCLLPLIIITQARPWFTARNWKSYTIFKNCCKKYASELGLYLSNTKDSSIKKKLLYSVDYVNHDVT